MESGQVTHIFFGCIRLTFSGHKMVTPFVASLTHGIENTILYLSGSPTTLSPTRFSLSAVDSKRSCSLPLFQLFISILCHSLYEVTLKLGFWSFSTKRFIPRLGKHLDRVSRTGIIRLVDSISDTLIYTWTLFGPPSLQSKHEV